MRDSLPDVRWGELGHIPSWCVGLDFQPRGFAGGCTKHRSSKKVQHRVRLSMEMTDDLTEEVNTFVTQAPAYSSEIENCLHWRIFGD